MSGIEQNGIIRDLTSANSSAEAAAPPPLQVTRILRQQTWIRAKKMRFLYVLLALPVVLLFVFNYLPMYGVLIAFVDYRWGRGVFGSTWNNFEHFRLIYEHPYFGRLMFNTVYISLLRVIVGFPAPILLALLLNEIGNQVFKRTVQTISYFPHFISWVILAAILIEILSPTRGPVGYLFNLLGKEPIDWLTYEPTFRGMLVVTGIWKEMGWGAIIFLGALSSIDPDLYESAAMDGANRFRRAVHITLPSLIPVITILFILRLGDILSAGFEQIFNLYNPLVYAVADVLDTYIYRVGLLQADYGLGAAVGLFKNIVALVLIFGTNAIIRRFSEYGIW